MTKNVKRSMRVCKEVVVIRSLMFVCVSYLNIQEEEEREREFKFVQLLFYKRVKCVNIMNS